MQRQEFLAYLRVKEKENKKGGEALGNEQDEAMRSEGAQGLPKHTGTSSEGDNRRRRRKRTKERDGRIRRY